MKYLILLIFAFSLFSCQLQCRTVPERADYLHPECYVAMSCIYYNKKNMDKSSCVKLIETCCDAMRIDRRKFVLILCKQYKFEGMTERECRAELK